jgi:uncharacterized protein YgfB (UPF0149 family)
VSAITFNELSQALASAGCQTEAAECHATLTGLICANPLGPDWMAQITGGGDSLDDCRDLLEALRENLQQSLSGDAFDFDLLLPGDDCELTERTESLAHWCQGFLFGLTVGGIEAGQALPGDAAEIVSDFARLAEAEHVGAATEEDERNYTELCEYVRAGTQLVYEEFAPVRKQSGSHFPAS